MESRAKFLGHSVHQQLVMFPLGLLGMAVIFDGIGYFTADPEWAITAFHMIGAGIVTGLIAAVFGVVDYTAIPGATRAKRIGAARRSHRRTGTQAWPQSSRKYSGIGKASELLDGGNGFTAARLTAARHTSARHTSALRTSALRTSALRTSALRTAALRTSITQVEPVLVVPVVVSCRSMSCRSS